MTLSGKSYKTSISILSKSTRRSRLVDSSLLLSFHIDNHIAQLNIKHVAVVSGNGVVCVIVL